MLTSAVMLSHGVTPGKAFAYAMESSGQGWKAIVVLCPKKMKAYDDTFKEIVGFSMSKFPRKVGHKYFQDLIILCL